MIYSFSMQSMPANTTILQAKCDGLIQAIQQDDLEQAKKLIQEYPMILTMAYSKNDCLLTPLLYMAQAEVNPSLKMFELIIHHENTHVNAVDKMGTPVLHTLAINQKDLFLKALLKARLNDLRLTMQDANGKRAIDYLNPGSACFELLNQATMNKALSKNCR